MSGGYRGPLLTRVLSADFELGSRGFLARVCREKLGRRELERSGRGGLCLQRDLEPISPRVLGTPDRTPQRRRHCASG